MISKAVEKISKKNENMENPRPTMKETKQHFQA